VIVIAEYNSANKGRYKEDYRDSASETNKIEYGGLPTSGLVLDFSGGFVHLDAHLGAGQ
jgi:hypothetical protein